MFRTAISRKTEPPIEYVEGFTEFLGCKIDLSKRPFIPRPETEYWVGKAIQEIRSHCAFIRCLDLFAGSGCIGIAVLKHVPDARVVFAEKEKKFIQQIKKNLALNKIPSGRYRLVQPARRSPERSRGGEGGSDLFSNIPGRYDFILANPPYLATKRKRFIQRSVLDWEPHGALFAGPDGLLYIRKFLRGAGNHLNPNGKIYMEFDSWQKPKITKIVRSFNFRHVEFFKDQYGKWRYIVLNNL
ncbi:MAG: peptide chain release factor N(5)-glutamine methyltransferase [Candidatus Wildermuthbacteria bacterium]|nr:peptide chain release factor N(5)-glutamine methyltransferase [Candidatus Wildermuthbacteria bacterium]